MGLTFRKLDLHLLTKPRNEIDELIYAFGFHIEFKFSFPLSVYTYAMSPPALPIDFCRDRIVWKQKILVNIGFVHQRRVDDLKINPERVLVSLHKPEKIPVSFWFTDSTEIRIRVIIPVCSTLCIYTIVFLCPLDFGGVFVTRSSRSSWRV